ncbi:ferrous iron transport protein B [Carnobacterium gallinarum]|uniref:ferrous iron transport protein B n=1 Tax=Carnobacterium gallinarum TaxID=2749 RepID=UPI000552D850|nr:ferrous iron transport protein B [Carnobacterium gallinarum]
MITIALAGNPNSGKTTLFNSLTGSNQRVGNWPGVTVERKEGSLKSDKAIRIMDLPGVYSLSPYTMEEIVTRDYLLEQKPDVVINLVDATNLERNLYLTSQLAELNIPMIIALNMMDIVKKNGDTLDYKKLSQKLGLPIVPISALKNEGISELIEEAKANVEQPPIKTDFITYSSSLEKVIEKIESQIQPFIGSENIRYYSIKLFEADEDTLSKLMKIPSEAKAEMTKLSESYQEELDDDGESIITCERYERITEIVATVQKKKATGHSTVSDKIDRVVTNRFLGLPIFAVIMFGVYYFSISTIGTLGTDWVNDVLFGEWIPNLATNFLTGIGVNDVVISLVVDGVIAGVGAILGFLPQMAALFLCLAILEDCGYMARIAFVMDRVFRNFGLSGKSFIPLLIGSGCSVPGIQASRTIENVKDRRITIMTTSFIPCGAKLPVIALIANAIFGGNGWLAVSMYFMGIIAVIVSGVILKKSSFFAGDPAPFVMELPAYHLPKLTGLLRLVLDKCWAFVKRAGSVIFVSSCIIWFLGSFSWSFNLVEDSSVSILAGIGRFFAPVFAPLGFGTWEASVATIQGFVAKENVVGTMGVLAGIGGEATETTGGLLAVFASQYTIVSALSFLVFNMLCMPCFAAVGAMRTELGSNKWTVMAVAYQMVFAYSIAFMVNQFGNVIWLQTGFSFGTALALIILAILIYLIVRPVAKVSNKYAERVLQS